MHSVLKLTFLNQFLAILKNCFYIARTPSDLGQTPALTPARFVQLRLWNRIRGWKISKTSFSGVTTILFSDANFSRDFLHVVFCSPRGVGLLSQSETISFQSDHLQRKTWKTEWLWTFASTRKMKSAIARLQTRLKCDSC